VIKKFWLDLGFIHINVCALAQQTALHSIMGYKFTLPINGLKNVRFAALEFYAIGNEVSSVLP
jgi:hypothetical protein